MLMIFLNWFRHKPECYLLKLERAYILYRLDGKWFSNSVEGIGFMNTEQAMIWCKQNHYLLKLN